MVKWQEYTGQKLWYHKVLINILEYVASVLEENKFPYWLYAGTLLGAVRNGKMIPWDIDIDTGIFSGDAEKLIKCFNNDGINQGVAAENKFSILVDRGKEGVRIIRIFCSEDTDLMNEKQKSLVRAAKHPTWSSYYDLFGIHVDIFPWAINRNEIYSVCKSEYRRPLSEVSTLDKIEFEGNIHTCPHPPESNLIRLYGKDCITNIVSYASDADWIKKFDPDNSDIIKEMEYYKL